MKRFHHVGLVTREPKPGEMYFERLKVWGTNPDADPNRIEWVRFAPDSPLASTLVAKMPHVAWQVDNLDSELAGKPVVVGPIEAAPGIRIAYFTQDEGLIEYLEVK
jgi:hypothetical protein